MNWHWQTLGFCRVYQKIVNKISIFVEILLTFLLFCGIIVL